MRLSLLLSYFLLLVLSLNAQQYTITLRPGFENGKDAFFKDLTPTLNQGNHEDMTAIAWTNGGTPVIGRCAIEFDLSVIPDGATITSAYLSLYNNPSSVNNNGLHTIGDNDAYIRRITSPWEEMSVTWNTQPSSTTLNEVKLPASTANNQDYTNIDVTLLVQDMVNNPASFGFLISLQTEIYYRSLILASSDHPDPNKHPMLVINYTVPVGIDNFYEGTNVTVYPNPARNFIVLDWDKSQINISQLRLIDVNGRIIKQLSIDHLKNIKVGLEGIPTGLYLIQALSEKEWKTINKVVVK